MNCKFHEFSFRRYSELWTAAVALSAMRQLNKKSMRPGKGTKFKKNHQIDPIPSHAGVLGQREKLSDCLYKRREKTNLARCQNSWPQQKVPDLQEETRAMGRIAASVSRSVKTSRK